MVGVTPSSPSLGEGLARSGGAPATFRREGVSATIAWTASGSSILFLTVVSPGAMLAEEMFIQQVLWQGR
jgi:hypothetical protein